MTGHERITIQPDGGGFDRLRCDGVRALSERREGNDLIFQMEESGEIRIVDQFVDSTVDVIEGCR